MRWLTLEQVLELHRMILEDTGSAPGIISVERLEAALSRSFASFEGHEAFPDLWSKVAALVHGIVSGHPFVDGNERVSFVAAVVCLRLNGYRLRQSDDAEDFFWSVARGEQTVDSIAEWLKAHSVSEEADP